MLFSQQKSHEMETRAKPTRSIEPVIYENLQLFHTNPFKPQISHSFIDLLSKLHIRLQTKVYEIRHNFQN